MPLTQILVVLTVVGVFLWMVNAFIPMHRKAKLTLSLLIAVAVLLWLLSVFGVVGGLSEIRLTR